LKTTLSLLALFLLSPAAHAAHACARPKAPAPSKLPTGNGLGYGVVAGDGRATTFLAHPYTRMAKLDHPGDEEDEDAPDAVLADNYLRSAQWTVHGKAARGRADYLDETHVVRTQGDLKQDAFQPIGLSRNALVLTASPADGAALDVRWGHGIASRKAVRAGGVTAEVFHFRGVSRPLVAVPLDGSSAAARPCPRAPSTCLSGSAGWALGSVENDAEAAAAVADVKAWQGATSPAALGAREAAEANHERPRSSVCFTAPEERKLYRQNESILRMAEIREPNTATRHSEGMINASLPEGEFAVPYVRDMAYATVSLSRTGHREEAEKALLSYFRAQPIGENQRAARGLPYQISTTRYFGDGSEEADRSGNPEPNLEFDDWGLALWAMGEHHKGYPDTKWLETKTYRGTVYESARDFVVKPLLGNLDPTPGGGLIVTKDSSVWEQNDEPRRHNAASTIAALGGLKAFLPVAEAMHDEKTAETIRGKIALLEKGFTEAFVKNGNVLGAAKGEPSHVKDQRGRTVPERNDVDGAVLEAINMGAVTDPKLARNIVDRVERNLKAPTGGYRRTNGPTGYERQEFVFISINLARAYLRLGEPAKAEALMKRVRELAAKDHGLIPELYQAECMPDESDFQLRRGSPAGAIPMVGYGAGAYNLYLAERDTLVRHGPAALPGGRPGGNAEALGELRSACTARAGDAPAALPAPADEPASHRSAQ
jgi:hypothetical protein